MFFIHIPVNQMIFKIPYGLSKEIEKMFHVKHMFATIYMILSKWNAAGMKDMAWAAQTAFKSLLDDTSPTPAAVY